MGPVRLDRWGPPMDQVVYIVLGRTGDNFSVIYVDHCSKSDDAEFFTKNPNFKCWVDNAGSEENLYVAIYPMFDSPPQSRQNTVDKIISKYKPVCNTESASKTSDTASILCACCGAVMRLERKLEKSDLYKCSSCGITDTRLR